LPLWAVCFGNDQRGVQPCHLASIPLIVSYVAGQQKALHARHAVHYAVAFTVGLFITIALVGVICALLGRMLGKSALLDHGGGAVLLWVAVDMLGLAHCSMSGSLLGRSRSRGCWGLHPWPGLRRSFRIVHLRFHRPILAIITIQKKVLVGVLFIVLFGIGHCVPIAVAGSSTAKVRKLLESSSFHEGGSGSASAPE